MGVNELLSGLVSQYIRSQAVNYGRSLSEPLARSELLGGALVYSYTCGSTVPVPLYSDEAKTIPMANPVILFSTGEAPPLAPPDGGCRIEVKSHAGEALAVCDITAAQP